MNPTTTGFLTQLLTTFTNIFATGFGVITPRAQAVLGSLAAIEIAFAALFWALRGEDFTAPFLRKLLRIGFFVFLVASWPTLTKGVADGLAQIGALAGGGSSALISDPSAILDHAMTVIKPIEDQIALIQKGPWYQKVAVLAVVIQYTIAELCILIAFAILAITCFLTYIEFFIVSVLGLILLPWGISNHTSFLAEKAIGAVIAQGVKLMVLSFIIAVIGTVLNTFTLQPAPPLMDTWLLAASAFVLAVLAVHAPALAGGLLSGSPSLTAGSAAGVAIGAGAAAVGVGIGAMALGRMAAPAAGKTIAAAGQIGQAGKTAQAATQASGLSTMRQAGAAVGAGAKEAGKIAATPATRIGQSIKRHWDSGVQTAKDGVAVAELRKEQRLQQASSRFKSVGAVTRAGNTAVKGLTTTHSGGSGNPRIHPQNDEI
jgi:type IV secretion system protein TrbL